MDISDPDDKARESVKVASGNMETDEGSGNQTESKIGDNIKPQDLHKDYDPKISVDDEDELEEGELKDDDDDDDDDDDEDDRDKIDCKKSLSKDTSDDSDLETRKKVISQSSIESDDSSSCSIKASAKVSEAGGNRKKQDPTTSSTRSSSPSIDHSNRPLSFRSRHDSDSRHSSRSQSRSKSHRSPANTNQQARLITMRAKLLEAKAREIELKFQKNKSHSTSAAPISATLSLTPACTVKTTVTKPTITYAENPNPVDPSPDLRKSSKSSKLSRSDKDKSIKKASKKRKKKSSSSSRKKKRSKISEEPKKSETSESKVNTTITEIPFDAVDHQGPKTPPDNQVLTLDDEQVEWPSYLIKMTITQPSISYSVNPDSVARTSATVERPVTADLNADFMWYYNYFINSYDMDKSQAHHQACSIIASSGCYGDTNLNRWLEQHGFSKHPESRDDLLQRGMNGDANGRESANLALKTIAPTFTILKTLNEITLPNGKSLPRGTIQKIVHPYPRPGRVIPDVTNAFFDMH